MWKKKKIFGSAVLTFIGYKQTNTQTDKPNLFIDYLLNGGNEFESFFQAEPDKIIRFLEFKTTLIKWQRLRKKNSYFQLICCRALRKN